MSVKLLAGKHEQKSRDVQELEDGAMKTSVIDRKQTVLINELMMRDRHNSSWRSPGV